MKTGYRAGLRWLMLGLMALGLGGCVTEEVRSHPTTMFVEPMPAVKKKKVKRPAPKPRKKREAAPRPNAAPESYEIQKGPRTGSGTSGNEPAPQPENQPLPAPAAGETRAPVAGQRAPIVVQPSAEAGTQTGTDAPLVIQRPTNSLNP